MSDEFKFKNKRPSDGETIETLFPDGEWYTVIYLDDGIDGLLQDEFGYTEIEEFPNLIWRNVY